ncbi:hypothetical protein LJ221_09465, partial [Streptomyces sp. CNQ085]|nr:hypothetical protein [Streptomyces sp. CNQ085]
RAAAREPVPTGAQPYRGRGGTPLTEGRVPRPDKAAPKADWVLYAAAELGVDPDQAESMTRAELIELPVDYADHAPDEDGLDGEDGQDMYVGDDDGHPIPPDDEDQDEDQAPQSSDGRPAQSAPKREWISYAVARGLVSREDAANYTKDDLIRMTK